MTLTKTMSDGGGVPVVGPLFNVHHSGVVLGHVALADATNPLLPGLAGGIDGGQTRRQRDEVRRRASGSSNYFGFKDGR